MPGTETARTENSAKALTLAAYASFVPIGIVTVLLAPMLPILSARWSLSDSQAGSLFTLQYAAATVTVALSGWLVAQRGYRFAINAGLGLIAVGMALLTTGSMSMGMAGIAAYGGGYGFAVPAANLLVAEVSPTRRSAALNTLNFCWSLGAVACPFLVAAANHSFGLPLFLDLVAGLSVLVAIGIAVMPASAVQTSAAPMARGAAKVRWTSRAVITFALLFPIYVGTETAFGGWVAKYSKTLGSMSAVIAVMTPSCFYGMIMIGRWLAPFVLRVITDVRLAMAGLLMASAGMVGLVLSHALAEVVLSACLAGLGLAAVYPITISLMAHEFGPQANRVGSLMFVLANLGGASLPLLVGVASSQIGSLKAGLTVPLMGSIVMFVLYLRGWRSDAAPA